MQKTNSTNNAMSSSDLLYQLNQLTKTELINLLLKQNTKPVSRMRRPIPTPRKSVKQMVQDYESNVILPPPQFRDGYKPVPKQGTKKPVVIKPVPLPRTFIEQTAQALKGYTVSYKISIKNDKDPLVQLQTTQKAIHAESHIKNRLISMKGLKFLETLKIQLEKPTQEGTIVRIGYFNSTAQAIINYTEINIALQNTKQQILNKVAQWISEGSGWIIKSVDDHYLNIVQYKPMKRSSYIELPKELRNSAKGLIN